MLQKFTCQPAQNFIDENSWVGFLVTILPVIHRYCTYNQLGAVKLSDQQCSTVALFSAPEPKEFNETWQEARSQSLLPSLCFSGQLEKQDGRPGLWLADTFSTSFLKPLKRIQQNVTGSKISTSSTKFVFSGLIGKTRCPPRPLIGWDVFDFCSETAERNSMKLDRKQDLKVLNQVCVFRANRKKQDGHPGLWLAETFSTSPLKPLNGIGWNLTGSKISTSSTKLVFFGLIGKPRWPPWPLIGGDTFPTPLDYIVAQQAKSIHWLNNI